MKITRLIIPSLILLSTSCGNAENKEAAPAVDTSLVRELDSAARVKVDTLPRRDTAMIKKKPVKRKVEKKKTAKQITKAHKQRSAKRS